MQTNGAASASESASPAAGHGEPLEVEGARHDEPYARGRQEGRRALERPRQQEEEWEDEPPEQEEHVHAGPRAA